VADPRRMKSDTSPWSVAHLIPAGVAGFRLAFGWQGLQRRVGLLEDGLAGEARGQRD
jgi:hypothetical protein